MSLSSFRDKFTPDTLLFRLEGVVMTFGPSLDFSSSGSGEEFHQVVGRTLLLYRVLSAVVLNLGPTD